MRFRSKVELYFPLEYKFVLMILYEQEHHLFQMNSIDPQSSLTTETSETAVYSKQYRHPNQGFTSNYTETAIFCGSLLASRLFFTGKF